MSNTLGVTPTRELLGQLDGALRTLALREEKISQDFFLKSAAERERRERAAQ